MAVYQLDDVLWFPDPWQGEDDGLVAVGGDLSVERLLFAYSNGYFPWYSLDYNNDIMWFCPLNRFVIFPNEIHISHSMRQLMRQQKYEVTFNQDFEGVIHRCATTEGRIKEKGAWLREDMIKAYTKLHRQGYATSVEVWKRQTPGDETSSRKIVGGLYGVTLRNAFFGESMFSLVPNASKLALITLANTLERTGGLFIDCQFETPHLASMGGRYISYTEYMKILNEGE